MTTLTLRKPLPKPKAERNPNFWRDNLRGYMFILPVVLGLLIWTLGPMIASAYFSLTSYKLVNAPEFIGFKNYIDLFTDDKLFLQSLRVTVTFAFVFVIFGQMFSLGVATLLTRKLRGISLFRTFYYIPIVVPNVASALLWRYLFNKEFGPINYVIKALGFAPISWLGSPDWALFSLVIISIWAGAVTTIVYVAGLQQVPEELYEAAKIDGANAWQLFVAVTIPMLTPTIFFNVVMNIISALQIFVPAFIMTKGGPVHSTYFYNLNLYEKAFKWLEMGYASAMAWVMFALIILLTALIFRSSPLWVYYEGEVKS